MITYLEYKGTIIHIKEGKEYTKVRIFAKRNVLSTTTFNNNTNIDTIYDILKIDTSLLRPAIVPDQEFDEITYYLFSDMNKSDEGWLVKEDKCGDINIIRVNIKEYKDPKTLQDMLLVSHYNNDPILLYIKKDNVYRISATLLLATI